MSFIGVEVIVRGVVQGVGFRFWTQNTARRFGLCGRTGNLDDGSVKIMAEGDRGLVEEFLKELRIGPTYASVTGLDVKYYETPRGFHDFRIVPMDKYD